MIKIPTELAGFIDHGIPVTADEARTAAVCSNRQGESRFVIAARGYILIVDPDTGECRQVYFPNGLFDYPFASMSSEEGLFYTGAGNMLMVFDPFAATCIFSARPCADETIVGFSFAEDEHGFVFTTTYPHCHLLRFDPKSQEITDYGKMDDDQNYAGSLAVDRSGWVYIGIGTERKNLVAFHPKTGEKQSLIPEEERTQGIGYVHRGIDGNVYGHYGSKERWPETEHPEWKKLFAGQATPVGEGEVSPSLYTGQGFNRIHRTFPDHRAIDYFSLSDRELRIKHTVTGEIRRIPLNYHTEGADLSPLVAGPDGNIYGTSNHPLHFFTYQPKKDLLLDYGGNAVEKGGGGNICAYAVQGDIIAGAAYAGGHLHLFDTSKPLNIFDHDNRNPKRIASYPGIFRPRCGVAHPDGEHVIFGGFPGYGAVGGALVIFNIRTHGELVIPNEAIVPNQSTHSLVVLEGGDLLGGTSIEAPGGARPRERAANIFRMHWRTKEILYRFVPVGGAREISLMEIDHRQNVHALTSDSLYFVFDPESQEVIYEEDLSQYGLVVRNGLCKGTDQAIYALLSQAIIRIEPDTFAVKRVAVPPRPITVGAAFLNGRIYYGSGSRLWSCHIKAEPEEK